MYQGVRLGALWVIHFEYGKVGGVVARMVFHHKVGLDVERLPVEVQIVLDNCQDEGVVGHHNLNIVRLSGESLEVSNWEVDPPGSFVPHEPNRHNIQLVVGWGVVGGCSGDFSEAPDLAMSHGGAIGMAERGRLVANWYGQSELGMGNWSIQNVV